MKSLRFLVEEPDDLQHPRRCFGARDESGLGPHHDAHQAKARPTARTGCLELAITPAIPTPVTRSTPICHRRFHPIETNQIVLT